MSRIVSSKPHRIDLGDGEWIDIKSQVSFAAIEPILSSFDKENEMANIKFAVPLLELAIVDWCLKADDTGTNFVAFAAEKIKDLNSDTVLDVFSKTMDVYFPQKKS